MTETLKKFRTNNKPIIGNYQAKQSDLYRPFSESLLPTILVNILK